MYKHQVSSYICQCILSSYIVNLALLALALQPTSVLLLLFQSSPIISSHISFIFHHFRSCSRMSLCLVNSYQVDPVSFQPSCTAFFHSSFASPSHVCPAFSCYVFFLLVTNLLQVASSSLIHSPVIPSHACSFFSLLPMCSHLSPVRPQFCYTSKLPDICRQSIFPRHILPGLPLVSSSLSPASAKNSL